MNYRKRKRRLQGSIILLLVLIGIAIIGTMVAIIK